MTTSLRAAVYLRISADRTGEAAGVGRQRADCVALAESVGATVVAELVDNDISAFSGKTRPAFQQLLEMSSSGELDIIIAYHVDRLYRRLRDLVPLLEVCEKHGIGVRTVKAGDLDLSTASGRTIASILGAVAEGESARMAERIRREKEARAREGRPNGSMRSLGYNADGTINEREAEYVRAAVTRLLAGESINSVVRWFNSEGLLTVRGGTWRHGNLSESIRRPKLAGLRSWTPTTKGKSRGAGPVIAVGQWEPIIDRAQFEQLAALLNRPRPRSAQAPLTGLLICGRCGVSLNSHNDRNGRRYACIKPKEGACGRLSISAKPVEAWVGAAVARVLYPDGSPVERKPPPSDPVEDQSEAVKSKLKQLARMFADDVITMDEWMVQRTILESRLHEPSKVTFQLALPPTLDKFEAEWSAGEPSRARALASAVLRSVTVMPVGKVASGFSEDRLVPDWVDF